MSKESNNDESTTSEKLSIDNPFDFQFHAAYLAYSDVYDKTTEPETRAELNKNITDLQQNQLDYATFYRSINQYRERASSLHRDRRPRIKTQRKREWRRKAQRRQRNKRHKK